MKDFPVFTTEFGVASLLLKEVPYREEAYIVIQSTCQPEELLKECVSFCRMVGAEKIYARGHEIVENYPLHCSVLEMRGMAEPDPEKSASLFPVTDRTVGEWRKLINSRMQGVDNAATLESRDEKKILESSGACFIHNGGDLLGLGWLEDGTVQTVAAVKPGAGETVMHSLMTLAEGEQLRLEVASTNERAIRLYERLGFLPVREISRWYRVL